MASLYPEVAVGGYTRYDGFVEFYTRVNALLSESSEVLDFGAGRGQWADGDMPSTHLWLRSFHERVARVVGTDPDPVVLENPTLDEAHVVAPGGRLPFDDASFDVVVADHVLEHVTQADAPTVAAEVSRVLKPGGWFAARTPHRWGMIALAARAVPNRLHTGLLTRLQPERQERDVFPTEYAMNTRRDLARLFPSPQHQVFTYGHTSEPRYFGNSRVAWRAAAFAGRLTPPALEPTLMVFIQKAPARA
jgi:SAM-dependent methyltransferase